MKNETIYALKNGDEWVYVGRSVNVRDRVHAHRARGLVFDSIVTLAVIPTRASENCEARAIGCLAPTRNVRKDGRGVHSKFGRRSSVRLNVSSDLYLAIKRAAAAERRTVSNWLTCFFSDAIKQEVAA